MEQPVKQEGQQSLEFWKAVFKEDRYEIKAEVFNDDKGWASLVVQTIKNLSAMQETWVRFLGQEDPLEKAMATHSSILA